MLRAGGGAREVEVSGHACPRAVTVRGAVGRPAPSLTRKSDGEWQPKAPAEPVIWYCCGFGIMRRHR